MSIDEMRLYVEGFAFIYNINNIMDCIVSNLDLLDNDDDNIVKSKLTLIAERFGEYILFKDGTEIDTSKYK